MSAHFTRDPDIHLAGLKIWVQGRQFPDLHDHWDGNWVVVHAECSEARAYVEATGPFLHLSELEIFTKELARTNGTCKGEAKLPCMEPQLSVHLKADKLGHITVTVTLTPDHLTQHHKFVFEIDQSYLGRVLEQCRKVLENYPLRGTPTENAKGVIRNSQ